MSFRTGNSELSEEISGLLKAGNPVALAAFWEVYLRKYEGSTQPLIESAQIFTTRGWPGKSLEILQKAKDLGHDTRAILLHKVHALRAAGEPEQALDLLFQLGPQEADSLDVALAETATYLDLRMQAEAQSRMESRLFKNPENPAIRLVFSRFYWLSGHYFKALRLAATIASEPDFELEAGLLGVECHRLLNQRSKMQEVILHLKEKFPQDPRARVLDAERRLEKGQKIEENKLSELLETFPGLIEGWVLKVKIALADQDFDAARRALYKALDRADWHEKVQWVHLQYAWEKGPVHVDWQFFEELSESGKYPGLFLEFIRYREVKGMPAELLQEYLEKARAQAPESTEIHLLSGDLLRKSGNKAGAMTHYIQAGKLGVFSPEPWFRLGQLHKESGNAKQAATAWKAALKADPTFAPANFELADLLQANGQSKPAIQLAQRYLDVHPEDPNGWKLLANCYQKAGNNRLARKAAKEAQQFTHELDPELLEMLLKFSEEPWQKAEVEWLMGDYDAAWKSVAQAIEKTPDLPEIIRIHIALLVRDGEFRLAIHEFYKLNDLDAARPADLGLALQCLIALQEPGPVPLIRNKILAERQQDAFPWVMLREAAHEFSHTEWGKPDDSKSLTIPASAWKDMLEGLELANINPKQARELILKARNSAPENEFFNGRTAIFLLRHFPDEPLLQEIEQWIWEERKIYAGAIMGRFLVHWAGREGEGMRMLSMVNEESPEHLGAAFSLAEALVKAYRVAPALGVLAAAAEVAPDNLKLHLLYGRTYLAGRKYDQAITAFEKVLETEPDHVSGWVGLGNAFLEKKRYEEAEKPFLKAAQLPGKSPALNYEIAQVLLLLEHPEKAGELAREAMLQLEKSRENQAPDFDPALMDKVENFLEKLS